MVVCECRIYVAMYHTAYKCVLTFNWLLYVISTVMQESPAQPTTNIHFFPLRLFPFSLGMVLFGREGTR